MKFCPWCQKRLYRQLFSSLICLIPLLHKAVFLTLLPKHQKIIGFKINIKSFPLLLKNLTNSNKTIHKHPTYILLIHEININYLIKWSQVNCLLPAQIILKNKVHSLYKVIKNNSFFIAKNVPFLLQVKDSLSKK